MRVDNSVTTSLPTLSLAMATEDCDDVHIIGCTQSLINQA